MSFAQRTYTHSGRCFSRVEFKKLILGLCPTRSDIDRLKESFYRGTAFAPFNWKVTHAGFDKALQDHQETPNAKSLTPEQIATHRLTLLAYCQKHGMNPNIKS